MYSVVIMIHYMVLAYNLTRRAPVFVHPTTVFGAFYVFRGYYDPLYGTGILFDAACNCFMRDTVLLFQ